MSSSEKAAALRALAVQYLKSKGSGKGAIAGGDDAEAGKAKVKRLRRMSTEQAEGTGDEVPELPDPDDPPKKPKNAKKNQEEPVAAEAKKPKKAKTEEEVEEPVLVPKKKKKIELEPAETVEPKKKQKNTQEEPAQEVKKRKGEAGSPEDSEQKPKQKKNKGETEEEVAECSPARKVQLFPEGQPKKMVASVGREPTIRLRTKSSLESLEESEERATSGYVTPSSAATASPGSSKPGAADSPPSSETAGFLDRPIRGKLLVCRLQRSMSAVSVP